MNKPKRYDVLDAAGIAVQDREGVYGPPQQHLEEVANMWSVILSRKLSQPLYATDVALMMAGLKISRLINAPDHEDSQVDLDGYASLLREVA